MSDSPTTRANGFAVVLHSSGPRGGFVVRERRDGWIPAPYGDATPLRVYAHRGAAQKHADRLNAPPMSGGSPYANRGTGWHADGCLCRACSSL